MRLSRKLDNARYHVLDIAEYIRLIGPSDLKHPKRSKAITYCLRRLRLAVKHLEDISKSLNKRGW